MSGNSQVRKFQPRIGTIIIPTDPFWVQTLEAILHANRKIGADLILIQPTATNREMYTLDAELLVDQVLAQNLDALIWAHETPRVLDMLVGRGLPIVCLSESNFRDPFCTVGGSLYQGGVMAGQFTAERLGRKGHAVCITAEKESFHNVGQSRKAGYLDALHGFPQIETSVLGAYWDYTRAYPELKNELASYPHHIDAIFGVSDTIAIAARDAGRELGIIDDQTVLVGLNGDPMALAAIAEGTLTATVNTASEQLGALAMELAYKAVLGERLPPVIENVFQLVTRENVASFAVQKLTAIANIPERIVGWNSLHTQDRLSQLEISMEITRRIGSLLDREQIHKIISELIREHYGFEWMRILRCSETEQKLTLYEGDLSPAALLVPVDADLLLQQALARNETIYLPDLRTSLRWQPGKEWEGIRSRAILPIQLGEKVIGVLDLQSSQPVRKLTLEIVGLKLLASQIGIAIQNSDLYLEALQARETAERANRLKTRLIANVGHEMRNPLNAILGFSQGLQRKIDSGSLTDPDALKQDVNHIYKSGEHLMYMINDLLDLSRAEIGALSLYFEPLHPVPFLKELFQEFPRTDSASKDVVWILDIPERLPIIRADLVRLRQILINLLANASKFTRHGSITLGAAVELPYLHLWVTDTGLGMPLDIQSTIFEPFGTTGRKRPREGIGLGLSITRHLVGLHDGLITVESQPCSGSTFNIYLPLPGVALDKQKKPADAAEQPILLVLSNQAEIPEEIIRICSQQDLVPCRVASRDDLNQALALGTPAAIAWDLATASSNEWSLIYRLSTNQQCAALPVILFGQSDQETGAETGLTNIVFKPCSGNSLADWISQIDCESSSEAPILIVDDDSQARDYYQGILEKIYPQRKLIKAENGAQALAVLQQETPALVILDLLMPEVDGFCVLERIRADARTQRVPVVIISGKLLNYEDLERLNYYKTIFSSKSILNDAEVDRLFQQVMGDIKPLPLPTSMVIKKGLTILHENYSRPISRKEIADAVGVSENYLSQIFRQEMCLSPWEYLNRMRILKAKEMLLNTDEPINRISNLVGIADPAYFSRVFHRHTGQSPQEFRQCGAN
jgi:signal transduction histidine kinase/ABC-type sugar transport system substrate-binding protein/AraC-like DNA-binding protein